LVGYAAGNACEENRPMQHEAGAVLRLWPGADVDESLWVKTASKTRICTTLVSMDSGEATEIVEPSGTVEAGEIAALLAALGAEREKRSGAAVPGVLVMGSMPPGVPKDTYGSIV
jgi:fructose-1-phosphate kinase PfkB-like protein